MDGGPRAGAAKVGSTDTTHEGGRNRQCVGCFCAASARELALASIRAEPVFRDDCAHFIPIERDFANHEQVLAGAYERTVARRDSVQRAGER